MPRCTASTRYGGEKSNENGSDRAAPRTALLSYPGGEHEMEIVEATQGSAGVQLGSLLGESGLITLDPGFVNTGSCRSDITYIDGDAGILRYRGYPIDQLAHHSTFVETSYLLMYGQLPTPAELDTFTEQIQRHTLLHEDLKRFFEGFPTDAHPMPVLSSAVSALSTFYQKDLDPFDEPNVDLSSVRLLAKVPTIGAYAYRRSIGQALLYPDTRSGWCRTSCG